MRFPVPVALVLLLPAGSFAQNEKIQQAVEQKLVTIRFVQTLQDPSGGFYPGPQDPRKDSIQRPSLRATSAAVRSLKYLTGKPTKEAVPHAEKVAAFVMSCYDPKTGGFGDTPGGKPDVAITSIGIMAAVELDVPREKYRKAMDYLKEHAKTFEEVRLGAAAVEAWGMNDSPFDVKTLKVWYDIGFNYIAEKMPSTIAESLKDGVARDLGSLYVMYMRVGEKGDRDFTIRILSQGQRDDGGWGKQGAKGSDAESTYRVMRAFHMVKGKPRDVAKLREFVAKCRNTDGGYGTKPGELSSVGGVYFATIVTKWLDEMEKK